MTSSARYCDNYLASLQESLGSGCIVDKCFSHSHDVIDPCLSNGRHGEVVRRSTDDNLVGFEESPRGLASR
jgi:hypothetical protein